MRRVEMDESSAARRKVTEGAGICPVAFEKHDWVYFKFLDVTVQICCADCGRTPLEIMAEWVIQSG